MLINTGLRVSETTQRDKEGQKNMSKIVEDTAKELVKYEKMEMAERMLERGKLTKEEIAEDLDLPLGVVEELANKLQLA